MNKHFQDLIDTAPVAREIKRGNKTLIVHFRRVTAGERLQLSAGQKMTFVAGKSGSTEMDLAELAKKRQLLVQFCCVDEHGNQLFADAADVQAQPDWLIAKLSEIATEVDRQEDKADEPGNV